MTDKEIDLLAVCAWKENRRGGVTGMQSIINSITNRLAHHRYPKTIEGVIMQPSQYTSMSVPSDPEYKLDPAKSIGADLLAWGNAQELAEQENAGVLPDLTHGATLYFSPAGMAAGTTIPYTLPNGTQTVFPKKWNPRAVRYACTICGQHFFVEL